MKNSKLFLIFIMLISIGSFAQEKGICLINKIDNDSIFLKENKRICIVTIYGQKISAKYKIIDDKTISIKGQEINLNNIIKIRKESTFKAIIKKPLILFGSLILTFGVLAAKANVNGDTFSSFILPGASMIVLSSIKNDHLSEKWEYQIKN